MWGGAGDGSVDCRLPSVLDLGPVVKSVVAEVLAQK